MWSPDGYYSWTDVLDTLFDISRQVLSLVCKGGEPNLMTDGMPYLAHTAEHYLIKQGFAENYQEAELVVGITTTMLLVNLIEQYPPCVVNLDGKAIRVNPAIFGHKDQLELCYFGWPVRTQAEFHSFFRFAKEGHFDTNTLLSRFAFIDGDSGEVSGKNGDFTYLVNGVGLDEPVAKAIISVVQRFSGYAVCWSEFPEGVELRDFLACIEVDDVFTKALNYEFGPPTSENEIEKSKRPKKGVGRPSLKYEAAQTYWRIYPDGHGKVGASWKVALAAVNAELPKWVSEDTLKRAVKEMQ